MSFAFFFPGQGSQSLNMMNGFDDSAVVKATFDEASVKTEKLPFLMRPVWAWNWTGNRYKRHMRPINVCLAVRVTTQARCST